MGDAATTFEDTAERKRGFTLTEKVIDAENRTAKVAFSTEKPVLITDKGSGRQYLEILDHGDGVNMSRMRSAPVLKDHDRGQQLGKVEAAEIDRAEKVGRATLKFSKRQLAEEEWIDVQEGIRSNVSVGYIPGKGVREPQSDIGGIPAFRFPNWMPYEISTVSVPEDEATGVGRSFQGGGGIPSEFEDAATLTDQQPNKTRTMATENTATVSTPAEPKVDIAELTAKIRTAELDRCSKLRSFGERVNVAPSEVQKAIDSGVEFDTFTRSFTEGAIATVAVSQGSKGPLADLEIGMNQKERKRFSIAKGLYELSRRGGLTGIEREVHDQCVRGLGIADAENTLHLPLDIMASDLSGRRRDLEAGTASEGGYSVATDLGGMIELLRNQTKVLEIGATQFTGLRGNLSLPKQDGAATASWVDEEGSVSPTAQTFGQIALTPNRLAAQTKYSDQLLAQSSLSVENFVRSDLMRVTAIELDRAALHGSGSSNQPLGLDGTSGVGGLTFGGAPTWADIVEFETDVAAANAMTGNASFLVSAATRGKWKTTVKVSGTSATFLIEGNEANGYTVHVSNNITGNIVFFGVWSQMAVATWAAMSVTVDPYTAAGTGQRIITTCSFHDVGVMQPTSFSISSDSGAQ